MADHGRAGAKLGIILIILGLILAGLIYSNADDTGQAAGNMTIAGPARPKPVPPPPPPYTFPDGGRTIFPRYRLVGLYGTPGEPVLGSLGQQPLKKSVARVKQLAKDYQPYSGQKMLPTFEIITTVASASPTSNHDYSREVDASKILPWIKAAEAKGIYVVLDLQSGRSSFTEQAKEYRSLLEYPNVGLALDPEWRLKPDQVPLVQIGSVNIKEVNATAKWLSDLTSKNKLPQKLFLLHEFRLDMLPDRSKLNTSYKNLAYAIQMDGQGTQSEKLSTWKAILADPPKNEHFGWKNFYQKDLPMRGIKATMSLKPKPWYVSYQ